ncbi:MAG: hypothetical protein E6R03_04810 [Hyphomicrobiaceae bacterium]|nr:MAG: hypothetical protein E6R03_04810 [Hyphomicrobiaceae bacterium]
MKVSSRQVDGEPAAVWLTAETQADRQRLSVILSDLGQNKVPPGDAVVVAGAGCVTSRRQVLLYLRGVAAPVTIKDVAAAVGLSAIAARARLIELVGLGDVCRTEGDRFDVVERVAAPERLPVGRPKSPDRQTKRTADPTKTTTAPASPLRKLTKGAR